MKIRIGFFDTHEEFFRLISYESLYSGKKFNQRLTKTDPVRTKEQQEVVDKIRNMMENWKEFDVMHKNLHKIDRTRKSMEHETEYHCLKDLFNANYFWD